MSKKVAVLMSGGVDSSVSALLLKGKGWDVTGIHLHCSAFCNPTDAHDARQVAQKLNIPFYVFDLTDEFEEKVINYMIKTYQQGLTPNPDVYCNQFIKFGIFFDKAMELGFEWVASGHYAQIENNNEIHILKARDEEKDQTYFLWSVSKENFKKIIFPIGNLLKTQVREIARQHHLSVAEKKESMGICFVGKVKLREFLNQYLTPKEGKIIDTEGKILGTHPGYFYFTEGQRHGLNIKNGGPYYVVKKIPEENLIVVAKDGHPLLFTQKIEITEINIMENELMTEDKILDTRFRHRQPLVKAKIASQSDNRLLVEFLEPQKMVAPGQSLVFYFRNYLVGGGIILKRLE
ncbi:MAG: tRNA 2-thiouridine(34) synthase MnmA [Patescibacteria group bacterium]|nr:tRNA 2-thiouridine(34) synthase MnmA [Patescibacteria group bacterium]